MKNYKLKLFWSIIISLSLTILSCKKCYNCENVCYYCEQNLNDTVCSTDFTNMDVFNTIISDMQSSGFNCTRIHATYEIEACKETEKQILENFSYECKEK